MARRSRWRTNDAKGDGEDSEWEFRHPQESRIAATVRLAKQVEIAASHEVKACSHQADRAVAEVVRLPGWARRNVRAAKQHARDVSIRFAGDASIKRSQSEPSLRRWCCVRRSGVRRRLGRPVASRHRRAAASARAAKLASSGMTTAAGVSARAALTSTAASRSSKSLTSQYSPSTAARLNIGVRRLTLLASSNSSGARATTIVVGSKRGNQTSGALSPRSSGSTGKPEPPASC